MKNLFLFALFLTLFVTVYSSRISRAATTETVSNVDAEAKSKFIENADELRKQVQGTIVRYYNDGKKSFSNLFDRAQTGLKKIGQTSGEQISKVFTSVRNTVTGTKEPPKDQTLSSVINSTPE